jgi:hypothetical protein
VIAPRDAADELLACSRIAVAAMPRDAKRRQAEPTIAAGTIS